MRGYFRETTWKERRINLIKTFYGECAEKWETAQDDRRVFHNMYNMIIAALETMDDNPNNYICCAVNHAISEDRETMDRIMEHFGECVPWKR